MITAAETRDRMNEDPRWWKIALFDFVDDFRYHKDPAAVAHPFEPRDEQSDATLAAVIESLCDEMELPIPSWLAGIPGCQQPYFVSGLENLKATAIVESPIRFRLRKVFVLENFLNRV
ncbi:MAG: hypothetical protein HOP17_11190 [Acidobacteria bacterium]|nr:hypothetical protein [Acidobacteriota bacterium]